MHELLDDFIESYGKPFVSLCLAAFVFYGLCAGYATTTGWKILLVAAAAALGYLQRYKLAEFLMKVGFASYDCVKMFADFLAPDNSFEHDPVMESVVPLEWSKYVSTLLPEV